MAFSASTASARSLSTGVASPPRIEKCWYTLAFFPPNSNGCLALLRRNTPRLAASGLEPRENRRKQSSEALDGAGNLQVDCGPAAGSGLGYPVVLAGPLPRQGSPTQGLYRCIHCRSD